MAVSSMVILVAGWGTRPACADMRMSQSAVHRLCVAEAQLRRSATGSDQTGIFPGSEEYNRHGSGARIENAWHGIVDGRDVSVLAGAPYIEDQETDTAGFDPRTVHGFVIVRKGEVGTADTTVDEIYTPTAVGSLQIVASRGNTLTLLSRQGYVFSLNVLTEQMVAISAPERGRRGEGHDIHE